MRRGFDSPMLHQMETMEVGAPSSSLNCPSLTGRVCSIHTVSSIILGAIMGQCFMKSGRNWRGNRYPYQKRPQYLSPFLDPETTNKKIRQAPVDFDIKSGSSYKKCFGSHCGFDD